MKPCSCGKEVRLRALRVSFNRRHGIEHEDGTKLCHDGYESCAWKPYPTIERLKPWNLMIKRWEEQG